MLRLTYITLILTAIAACVFLTLPETGHAARITEGGTAIVYTTAELQAAIGKGPRCIHVDNETNQAYVRNFRTWEYLGDGDEHIVWERGTPVWLAARAETAFAVISRHTGTGHISGWTCARYTAAQVPI